MLEIGKYNILEMLRATSVGLYLGDAEGNEVLLPRKYVPEDIDIGDAIKVFIYRDSEERIISTTLEPKITLHRFAYLMVKEVSQYGAFLDWGLEKDLFVPFREQPRKMKKGQPYLVFLYLDEETDRLVASGNVNKFLDNTKLTVRIGEEVDVLIGEATDLGMNVIINQIHKGLIYYSELFAQLKPGEVRKGYIKKIREGNKIDVTLQRPGYDNIEPVAQSIFEKLKEEGGFLPLTDKSPPEEITLTLEMSKKTFKKAIGSLYKKKIIRLEKDGIYLN